MISGDIIVSYLRLLLDYCARFYSRQFITRKMADNDLLSRFEQLLKFHFEAAIHPSLPTVSSLAAELNVSASYLSDMLRTTTGLNTQQHLHAALIEKAKEQLATTHLSVSEIAFSLGFEFPQSFSKLFKSKTEMSPRHYRQLFN